MSGDKVRDMVNKLEMRAMLATACGEGIMDHRMVKNGTNFTKCWFFLKSEVQKEEKQELKKSGK